jgi:hypothetical protein
MRSLFTYPGALLAACLFLCAGCVHYSGIVVDARGRPVAHAKVEGADSPPYIINGSPPVTVSGVTDADGKFTLASAEPLWGITATSPDSKRRGHFTMESLKKPTQPIVITVK